MTYFVSFGTQTLTQSITIMGTLSVLCLYDAEADVDDCDGVVLVVDDCDGVILVAGVFHGRGRADAGGNQSVPGWTRDGFRQQAAGPVSTCTSRF